MMNKILWNYAGLQQHLTTIATGPSFKPYTCKHLSNVLYKPRVATLTVKNNKSYHVTLKARDMQEDSGEAAQEYVFIFIFRIDKL